jgi:hypothetical protein
MGMGIVTDLDGQAFLHKVSRVNPSGVAAMNGVCVGDCVIKIGDTLLGQLSHPEILAMVKHAGTNFDVLLLRAPENVVAEAAPAVADDGGNAAGDAAESHGAESGIPEGEDTDDHAANIACVSPPAEDTAASAAVTETTVEVEGRAEPISQTTTSTPEGNLPSEDRPETASCIAETAPLDEAPAATPDDGDGGVGLGGVSADETTVTAPPLGASETAQDAPEKSDAVVNGGPLSPSASHDSGEPSIETATSPTSPAAPGKVKKRWFSSRSRNSKDGVDTRAAETPTTLDSLDQAPETDVSSPDMSTTLEFFNPKFSRKSK